MSFVLLLVIDQKYFVRQRRQRYWLKWLSRAYPGVQFEINISFFPLCLYRILRIDKFLINESFYHELGDEITH